MRLYSYILLAGVVQIWLKPGEPGKIESITGWPVLLGGPRSDNPVPEVRACMEGGMRCPHALYSVRQECEGGGIRLTKQGMVKVTLALVLGLLVLYLC